MAIDDVNSLTEEVNDFREKDLSKEDKKTPILLYLILEHYLGATYFVQLSFFLVKLMNLSEISSLLN